MKTLKKPESIPLSGQMHRRRFLGYMAGTATIATVVAACNHSNDYTAPVIPVKPKPIPVIPPVNLGSGDIGILNYAFALEQLEAAFYTEVIKNKFYGINDSEVALLTDIRDHEIAHREFLRAALGTSAIPSLKVNFSAVNFSSRDSVLGTAKTFEDLGVSAYNGAGKLLTNANYLLIAGKIVSVEARHAAYIRDLISYGSFSDSTVVNSMGLDGANSPSTVLQAASAFLTTKLDASHLPTN